MKNSFIVIVLLISFSSLMGQNESDLNCFSILVGKNASVDGSVFFAHNEDDEGENYVDIHKVPRIKHTPGEKQYNPEDDFPFSFKPKQKVGIQELMDALQNHYEGTRFTNKPSSSGSPHSNRMDTLTVCNGLNDYSCITQLRSWLPADIGNILWIAPRYPCMQPYIPWYYGITKISPDFEKITYTDALVNYNIKMAGYKKRYPGHACWVFDDFANKMDNSYKYEIKSVRAWKTGFEMNIFNTLKAKESEIMHVYKSNPDKARQMLTDLSNNFAEKALSDTKKKLLK